METRTRNILAFALPLAFASALAASSGAAAESVPVLPAAAPAAPRPAGEPPFPAIYSSERLGAAEQAERARPYWVPSEEETAAAARLLDDHRPVLLNDDILAFYGHPNSKRMGILGWYPLPEMARVLDEWAAKYDAANGGRGLRKAFYLIYGTAWPAGEIGLLSEAKTLEYIEYARANGILVFLDHQIGKYSVPEAMKRLLPYLRYPNVHLALDPEWRTHKPMEEIGSVDAEELNEAQKMMEDYIVEKGYPGERLLVVHQFHYRMILRRELVRSDFKRVRLVHCADGFGPPSMKRSSYAFNAKAGNIPVKSFKLFFKSGQPGAGFDEPLLTPEEVFALEPRPYFVMYQ